MFFCLIAMPPTIPEPPFGGFDIHSEFLPAMDFGEAFDFGADFSFLPTVDFLDASFLSDEVIEYDNVSCNFFVESVVLFKLQIQITCSKNCTINTVSVRTSC
jgi:hypothetical protein